MSEVVIDSAERVEQSRAERDAATAALTAARDGLAQAQQRLADYRTRLSGGLPTTASTLRTHQDTVTHAGLVVAACEAAIPAAERKYRQAVAGHLAHSIHGDARLNGEAHAAAHQQVRDHVQAAIEAAATYFRSRNLAIAQAEELGADGRLPRASTQYGLEVADPLASAWTLPRGYVVEVAHNVPGARDGLLAVERVSDPQAAARSLVNKTIEEF